MRLFPLVMAFLVVFALGMAVDTDGWLKNQKTYAQRSVMFANLVDDAKKQESKDKKVQAKESLIEKYNKEAAKTFKVLTFYDVESAKISGDEEAKELAIRLNRFEKSIAAVEAEMKAKKDNKEYIAESKMLLADTGKFLGLKAQSQKTLEGSRKLLRFGESEPKVVYRLEWSPKGQWVVKTIKRGSA